MTTPGDGIVVDASDVIDELIGTIGQLHKEIAILRVRLKKVQGPQLGGNATQE